MEVNSSFWTELASVAIYFPKESMLLITDCHMNTWKFDFIQVSNLLCAQLFFFTFTFCVVTFWRWKNADYLRLFFFIRRPYFRRWNFWFFGVFFSPKLEGTSIPRLCEQTVAIKIPCGDADELDSLRINCTCSNTKSYSQQINFFTAVLSAMLWFRQRNMNLNCVNKYPM